MTDYEFEMRWEGGQKIILPIVTALDVIPDGCNYVTVDEEEVIKWLDGYEENELTLGDVTAILESLNQGDHTSGYFYDIDEPDEYYIRRVT